MVLKVFTTVYFILKFRQRLNVQVNVELDKPETRRFISTLMFIDLLKNNCSNLKQENDLHVREHAVCAAYTYGNRYNLCLIFISFDNGNNTTVNSYNFSQYWMIFPSKLNTNIKTFATFLLATADLGAFQSSAPCIPQKVNFQPHL